jgi:hypothetical protein
MSLEELANAACEHLPDGWELELKLERGSGGVTLFDPCGTDPEISFDGNDLSLDEQVQVCVDFARVREDLPPHFDENFDASDWE